MNTSSKRFVWHLTPRSTGHRCKSTSPDRVQARRAPSPHTTTVAHDADIPALWQLLGALPPAERDNVVSGLAPNVRAGLAAIANQAAIAGR
jgi:hypothetical protein